MSWRFKWQRLAAEQPLSKNPPPRYSSFDSVLYVLTLCAAGTLVSFASELPLKRVLGINFVTGWFALDLVWSPFNAFVQFDQAADFIAHAASVGVAILLWWNLAEEHFFLYANAIAALALGGYWVLTENAPPNASLTDRASVRVLTLYGGVTILALLVCWQQDIDFVIHPWYVAFVLNALATVKRKPILWTRAAHGLTWGTLIYELGKDSLVFSKFFY